MMQQHIYRTFFLIVFILVLTNLTDAFDCYNCANCGTTQRGVQMKTRPGDWCYKIVWRTGIKGQEIISRGASPDCRQDSYNDQSIPMQNIYLGTARYCCRGHLCNRTSKPSMTTPLLFFLSILSFFLISFLHA